MEDNSTIYHWMNGTGINNGTTVQAHPGVVERPLYLLAIASSFYLTIISIGVIGNANVIWVVCKYSSMRKSVMNIYIMNMSVADLTLSICGVPDVIQFFMDSGWVLGPALCKILRYSMVTCLYVSILCLLVITIER